MAFRRKGNAVKLTIKPFKVQPVLPEDFEEQTWKGLEAYIDGAFNDLQPVNSCKQDLYNGVEEIVLHNRSVALLQKLVQKFRYHATVKLSEITERDLESIDLLWTIHSLWTDYTKATEKVRQVFLPLDRIHIIYTEEESLIKISFDVFGRVLEQFSAVRSKTIEWFVAAITEERDGIKRDGIHDVLKSLLQMFLLLSIYHKSFEQLFLEKSNEYYRADCEQKMKELSLAQYIKYVEKRLVEEESRLEKYLDSSSRSALLDIVRYNLLKAPINRLLDVPSILQFLRETKAEEFNGLYLLFSQIDCLAHFEKVYLDCAKIIGEEVLEPINTKTNRSEVIPKLLLLKKSMDIFEKESFCSDVKISNSAKVVWRQFLNADFRLVKEVAILLAAYCDAFLRISNDLKNEEWMDRISSVMLLFRFIEGKDFFEERYRIDFCKRSLSMNLLNMEAENAMLNEITNECGVDFTRSLAEIFKDLAFSDETKGQYVAQKHEDQSGPTGVEFEVKTLSKKLWFNFSNKLNSTLPPIVRTLQGNFMEFYKRKYDKRSLNWCPNLGTVVLRGYFRDSRVHIPSGMDLTTHSVASHSYYDISVSQMQAICLLQFNIKDAFSVTELQSLTGISAEELHKLLLPLTVNGETQILCRLRNETLESQEDIYCINEDFHTEKKLEIPLFQNEIPNQGTEEEERSVPVHTTSQIEASLVRILKVEKSLEFSELTSLLYARLPFHPDISEIRKRIDSLINRSYIKMIGSFYVYESN